VSPSAKKISTVSAAIKVLTQPLAAAVIDWDKVNNLPQDSEKSHPLETFVTSLLATGHFAIPVRHFFFRKKSPIFYSWDSRRVYL
jgi:hypothetical protein